MLLRTQKNCSRLVIVPLYNEKSTIKKVITKVTQHTDADILIIDDGSTDGSHTIVQQDTQIKLVRNPQNLGYGQTLINGFQYAINHGYEIVVTMDCDEQHEPQMIPLFFEESHNCDILSGSRYLTHFPGDNAAPKERRSINIEMTRIINEITGFNLTDSFCGFKSYKADSLKRLRLFEPGYGMPLQLWLQAWHHGLQIQEKGVVRIYKDLERTFGNNLNVPNVRLQYYKKIVENEMIQLQKSHSFDTTGTTNATPQDLQKTC